MEMIINLDELKTKAIWLKCDGTIEYIEPDKSGVINLEQLQEAVGGYVEICPQNTVKNAYLFVDEEGLLKHKRLNLLCKKMFGFDIVGDALLVSDEMVR